MASSPGVMAQRPDPVTARIAPYTGRSSLILFGGLALIGLNALASYEGHNFLRVLVPAWPAPNSRDSHTSLLDLGAQVILLMILLVIASVSDEGGSFALLFLMALWLGWLFVNRAWFIGLGALFTPSSSKPNDASSGGGGAGGSF